MAARRRTGPRPTTRARLVLLTLLPAFALGACGPAGAPVADAPGVDDGATSTPSGPAAPRLETPSSRPLPFSAHRAAIEALTGPTVADDAERRRRDAVERSVAACMAAEGFDYTPRPWERAESVTYWWLTDVLPLPFLPDDPAQVALTGYGVDDVETQETLAGSAATPDALDTDLAGLGDAALAAYQQALTGVDGVDDPDPDPDGGCAGRAEAEHPAPVDTRPDVSGLVRAMADVVEVELFATPDVRELTAAWTACMLDRGVDVADPASPDVRRPGPTQAYWLAVATRPDGTVVLPSRDTAESEMPLDARYLVGSEPERTVAVADHACRAETDYAARLEGALVTLQEQLVATHREELDRLAAAAAGV